MNFCRILLSAISATKEKELESRVEDCESIAFPAPVVEENRIFTWSRRCHKGTDKAND
jgi:hypothetical protein